MPLDPVEAEQCLAEVEEELADDEVDAGLRLDLLVEHVRREPFGVGVVRLPLPRRTKVSGDEQVVPAMSLAMRVAAWLISMVRSA